MIDLAYVVGVNFDSHTVDLIVMDSAKPMSNVRVMSTSASTDSGLNDLALPDIQNVANPFDDGGDSGSRNVIACVSYYREIPMVIGFLFPQVSQMLFSDVNRKVDRHASDVYTTIDGNGNYELAFPNGAFIRVAETPEHEDLTGQDFNGQWQLTRNTDKQLHIHIEQAGGTAVVDIAPDGSITLNGQALDITTKGAINMTAAGNMVVDGNLSVTSGATGTFQSPLGDVITVVDGIVVNIF